MEAGEQIGLNQRVLHSVCGLLLVTGCHLTALRFGSLSGSGGVVILHRAGSVKCTSHVANRAPWGGQALGAPSVTQGRAPRGRTSHQPEERGDPGVSTGGGGLGIFLINQGRLTNVICVLSN